MNRREPENFYLNIPNPWSQIERVAPRFIGKRRDLGFALNRCNRSTRQELIGRTN
jgi:hypothetical protein